MAKVVLITDTREQDCLVFPSVVDCSTRTATLNVGDYSAEYEGITFPPDDDTPRTIFERKSIADCFGSFTGERYLKEKAKIERASKAGLKYVIAIEGSIRTVIKGHEYWANGKMNKAKKDGMAQFRQLLTMSQKYNISVMFFSDKTEMALFIQEFFVAPLRRYT